MTHYMLVTFACITFSLCSYLSDALWLKTPATPRPPRVFIMDGKALVLLRDNIRRSPNTYADAMAQLKQEASKYLDVEPWTITKKNNLPPSGDLHDYESQGPYWWPNPETENGLPYIRRDGEVNPEIKKLTDHDHMTEMTKAVQKLALAFYLTGEESFAEKAATFLRTWFLDAGTRMNPHLRYGQRIPGRTEGRDIGIIETRNLGDITDAAGLLRDSRAWTRSDEQGLRAWMREYLDWLRNSDHGRGEARQPNNHGTWYDVQVAALALYTDQPNFAREALLRARNERLPKHIAPDGRQPHELARTRSWSYSIMNLQSFFTLAAMAEKIGIEFWDYKTGDGRSIMTALDFLVDYAEDSKPWPFTQITDRDPAQIVPLLYQAACRFPSRNYRALIRKIERDTITLNVLRYPCADR